MCRFFNAGIEVVQNIHNPLYVGKHFIMHARCMICLSLFEILVIYLRNKVFKLKSFKLLFFKKTRYNFVIFLLRCIIYIYLLQFNFINYEMRKEYIFSNFGIFWKLKNYCLTSFILELSYKILLQWMYFDYFPKFSCQSIKICKDEVRLSKHLRSSMGIFIHFLIWHEP